MEYDKSGRFLVTKTNNEVFVYGGDNMEKIVAIKHHNVKEAILSNT